MKTSVLGVFRVYTSFCGLGMGWECASQGVVKVSPCLHASMSGLTRATRHAHGAKAWPGTTDEHKHYFDSFRRVAEVSGG